MAKWITPHFLLWGFMVALFGTPVFGMAHPAFQVGFVPIANEGPTEHAIAWAIIPNASVTIDAGALALRVRVLAMEGPKDRKESTSSSTP